MIWIYITVYIFCVSVKRMHVISVVSYIFISFAVIFFNKLVLYIFNFTSVAFIMLCRAIFTVLCLIPMAKEIHKPTKDIVILSFFNVLNILFTLLINKKLSIPVATSLQRFSIFTTMIVQYPNIPDNILYSVLIMVFGSLVVCFDNFHLNTLGIIFGLISNVLTTCIHLQTKKTLCDNVNKISILFWSAILSIVVDGAALVTFNPETFEGWNTESFQMVFVMSIVLGFCSQYSSTWVIEKNNALTLSVAIIVKNLLFDGMMLFYYKGSITTIVGTVISTIGALSYIYHKS